MMARKRTAIIGLDHYHATGWAASLDLFPDEIEIVALFDPDPSMGERMKPTWFDPHLSATFPAYYSELPFASDLGVVIDRYDLDLALVTLPNAKIADAVTRLAAGDVHMLVDKPGGIDAPSAAVAYGHARDRGVRVASGFLRRYGRGWQQAKAMIDSGRIGEVLSAEAVFNTSSPFVRDPENALFRRDLQGGGILIWLGVHDIDQLQWLTGQRIISVQAMTADVNHSGIDVEDAISMAFQFENSGMGTLHAAYVFPRTLSDGYVAVRGTKASVSVSFDGTLHFVGGGTASDPVIDETLAYSNYAVPGYGAMAPAVIRDLLDSIDQEREPVASGETIIDALRVVDAAYASAREGTRIAVNW